MLSKVPEKKESYFVHVCCPFKFKSISFFGITLRQHHITCFGLIDVFAGFHDDLFELDLTSMAWKNLSSAVSGTPPSPRSGHGFTSINGKLYVFGGQTGSEGE
jgi:hypothetical protein